MRFDRIPRTQSTVMVKTGQVIINLVEAILSDNLAKEIFLMTGNSLSQDLVTSDLNTVIIV